MLQQETGRQYSQPPLIETKPGIGYRFIDS